MGAVESKASAGERDREVKQLKEAVQHGRVFRESIPPHDISSFDAPFSPEPASPRPEPHFEVIEGGKQDLPTLPREIWEKIILHLRRRMGSRAEGDEKSVPTELHQHDLTVAMRKWYSIAAPILYTRVITIRPDLLLSHIHSKPISPNRLSKLELFQYIYRLDVGYDPSHANESDIVPPFSKSDREALSRAGLFSLERSRWPAVTLVRDVDIALRTTRLLREIRQSLPEGIQLFGNLQILTVGAFGKTQHSRWDVGYNFLASGLERFQPPSNSSFNNLGGLLSKRHQDEAVSLKISYQFGYELTSNCPSLQHLCVDNFTGPLSIFIHRVKNLQSYTIHITKSHTDTSCRPLPLIQGVTNNWIIEDGSWDRLKDTGRKDWIVDRGSTYQWLLGRIYDLRAEQFSDPRTKLVFHGALSPMRVDEEFGGYLKGFQIQEWDEEWSWERKRAEVDRYLGLSEKGIEGIKLEEHLEGRCEACGSRSGRE
uniref:Uncharacterized protein n=1 Tax=Kwoniella bestiolae CBS 10118 TaxID=1296100 RepID=A0A1B9FSX1_9TREE|nr:hypothetical protein I302_08641 [Kwoniella bestiolae CBS 10118]OCF21862.1 hypothetical protein I302_08641 [Kwoniella bestiolae CBS 10118]